MDGVDQESPVPIWLQIVALVQDRIESGELTVVISETRIMGEYGVSRGTASKALTALEAEGLVVRVPGRGTFIRPRDSIDDDN